MNARTKRGVQVKITLNSEEADWLRNVVQNPIGVTSVDEDQESRDMRRKIWDALEDIGQDKPEPNCGEMSGFSEAMERMMKVVTDLIQNDPHQWSSRPCTTCRAASSILGYDFGCIKYAKDRKPRDK